MRPEVKILKVLRITPDGNYAWVLTDVGKLRKPLKAIPKRLIKEFEGAQQGQE